ncbi:hypothetical protein AAC387_Pa04g1778 [Persea americana]
MATAPLATAAPGRPAGAPSPVGLWYGNTGTSRILPTADQLIELYRVNHIKKMWLCCPTPRDGEDILKSINTKNDIEVVLYIPATEVPKIARGAHDWIQLITAFQTVITYVCLGEVADQDNNYMTTIVPAMDQIHSINPISPIKGSTLVDVNVIFGAYEPKKSPSSYTFHEKFKKVLREVFTRLGGFRTPLFVKTLPYYAIHDNIVMRRIGLDNYLLKECASSYMHDEKANLDYKYVFDAMVDSISCAINAMGFSNVDISVVSGWPTAGSTDATIENARTYNNHLLRHVNEDTPRKTKRIDHFIFGLLDGDFATFTLWKNKTFPEAT